MYQDDGLHQNVLLSENVCFFAIAFSDLAACSFKGNKSSVTDETCDANKGIKGS